MKSKSVKLFSTALLMSLSTLAAAHGPMYTDYYEFDNSNEGPTAAMFLSMTSQQLAATNVCTNGSAAGYPCDKVDLKAFMAKAKLGGGSQNLNDIWGWTDPINGNEIAIVGRTHGTAFVNITDAENPVFLGFLPSHGGGSSSWRDMKVYNDHAFIVADAISGHGLQVFDLTTLRNVNPGGTLSETTHLGGFGNAHNIAINEDSGFAYIVGSNQCSGGLYMVDVTSPASPKYAGCFSADGYTHDAQCVNYNGPDSRYAGREICAAYNEDTITLVDVTNKNGAVQISRTGYSGSQYTHQGWFLDNQHSTIIMNDELDEQRNGVKTTSYIYDVSDLRNPRELGRYIGPTAAIDHNLYTMNGYVFESNYRAGLRILKTDDIANGNMTEVAYFDTIPGSDAAQFSGTWSNYPYFASGNVVTSDIGTGLFIVAPDWNAIGGTTPPPPPPGEGELSNGVAVANLSGQRDEELDFYINVPAGAANLKFELKGTTVRGPGADGDADLYVRFGSAPTLNAYDCRPYLTGNNETCAIQNIQTGRYYVKLVGYRAFNNVSITASYTTGTTPPSTSVQTVSDDLYVGSNGRFKDVTNVFIDGDHAGEETRGLIKFSIDVPSGRTVSAVSLRLDINNSSGDSFGIFAAMTDWSETNADWISADLGGVQIGTIEPLATGSMEISLNAAGVELVQSWVNGVRNNGIVIGALNGGTDGMKFYAKTHATGRAAELVIQHN